MTLTTLVLLAALGYGNGPVAVDDLCRNLGGITNYQMKERMIGRGWPAPDEAYGGSPMAFETWVWKNRDGTGAELPATLNRSFWVGFGRKGSNLVLSGCETCYVQNHQRHCTYYPPR
jgi:hypothetical protein